MVFRPYNRLFTSWTLLEQFSLLENFYFLLGFQNDWIGLKKRIFGWAKVGAKNAFCIRNNERTKKCNSIKVESRKGKYKSSSLFFFVVYQSVPSYRLLKDFDFNAKRITKELITVFENHQKSLIDQKSERSELRLFLTIVLLCNGVRST